jgi:hypothetical protein
VSSPAFASTSGLIRSSRAPGGRLLASRTDRPVARDSTRSTAASSSMTVVPSARVIDTRPSPGSYRARIVSNDRHLRGCFALATSPVSWSISAYRRSPATPPRVSVTEDRASPSIDLTG